MSNEVNNQELETVSLTNSQSVLDQGDERNNEMVDVEIELKAESIEIADIDSTNAQDFQKQLAQLVSDFKESVIVPEGEPLDWTWEITLKPSKFSPSVLHGSDERVLMGVEYGSDEHNLVYDLMIVSGMVMRKLDSFEYNTPEDEDQVLSLFFENKWSEEDMQAIDSVLEGSDFPEPIDRIIDLLDDPDSCISIRVAYSNCVLVLYFYEFEIIESESITIAEDGTELREARLATSGFDSQTYPASDLTDFELPKLIIHDDEEAIEMDTALIAMSLAYSDPVDRIERIAALAETEVYPHDLEDEDDTTEEEEISRAKPVTLEYKKKRKAKNKQAKKQRKQARRKK